MAATGLIAFVGPTAHGLTQREVFPDSVSVRPPVRRGDIAQLLEQEPGRAAIAIVDGTFHSYPSVGHAEIRDALTAGWQVWGLCSMGAIRAAEMQHMGMLGYGQVFHAYATDPDLDDDEVALVHGAEAPHRPVSEPMIHLRAFLAHLAETGQISAVAAQTVTSALKQRWYGERTLWELRSLLERSGLTAAALDQQLSEFGRFRLKTQDLIQFMRERPWQSAKA